MGKLLVLGNGFDLHCGLKTSYSDFFEFLLKNPEYKKSYNYLYQNHIIVPNQGRVNIWWALFLAYYESNEKYDWKDIEGVMSAFLYQSNTDFSINLKDFIFNREKYMSSLNQLSNAEVYSFEPIYKFLWILNRGNKLGDFGNIVYPGDGRIEFYLNDIKDIYNLLAEDLSTIEKLFAEYLIGITRGNKAHYIANDTYCDILGIKYGKDTSIDERASLLGSNLDDASVMSFNYTRLGQPFGGNFKGFKNIHGTIEEYHKEVIFGIDSYDILPDDPSFRFTKTYRVSILENTLVKNGKLFDGKILLNDVNEILIYGHSLSEQDFSYFAAVFSKCNINESDTSIKFYYSDFDEVDRAPYHILNLQKLIKKYEIEFNKPNGLYHRMLIEGRIEVKRI